MKGISRRRFLAASLAGGAATTLSVTKEAWGASSFEGYPDGMGVLVDLTRCVGCRSCEAACNKEQNLPAPAEPFDDMSIYDKRFHGQKRRTDENAYTVVNRYDKEGAKPIYRKIQCNHCNEPACLTSCFTSAYKKTKEGAVTYNSKVCVGCRNCMVACPFGIPGYGYSSALNPEIKKCVFCHETRLKNGQPPACVEACPQEVMVFGKRRDLIKIANDRIRTRPGRYIDHIYGEHEVGGTAWLYLSDRPFEEVGFDTTLSKEPIISNVKGFLSTVPMVLAIWPALFTGFHLLSKKKDHGHGEHAHSAQEEDEK